MSNTRNDQRRLRLEAGRIAGLIDEHRRRAHSTPSVPEKVQLITALSALRRTQTRLDEKLLPPPVI